MKKILFGLLGIFGLLFVVPGWALPSGYTELEYIESTGTQYIDTGYKFTTNNHKYIVKFSNVSAGSSATAPYWLWGSNNGAERRSGAMVLQTSGKLGFGVGNITAGTSSYTINNPTSPITLTVETKDNNTFSISGGSTDYTNVPFEGTTISNLNEALFGTMGGGSSIGYTSSYKLYNAKIYDNNTLVRDFVPAKNSSGVVGMYDTVNDVFYENKGTGEFVAGDPVTDNSCRNLFDKDAEYINAYVNANSGVLTIGNSGSTTQYSFVIPVQPNTKYTLSGMSSGSTWGSFTDNSIGATATSKLAGNGTLTTGANDKYLIGLAYASGTQYDYRQTLQIEEGDVATEYVPYCEKITIATTKYNESAFSPLNTALANAISVVDTVVSNTITQAGRIATLQAQKQTRPADDTCPAYKQCLLVEDEQGVPHWYEITDPFRDFVAPIIANNVAPASTTNDTGYTQLEYIDVQQYAKIELPHQNLTNNFDVEFQVQWPENPTTYEPLLVTMKVDNAWFGGYNSNRMALRGYSGTDYVLISKPESGRVVTINFRANNNSTSIYYNGVLQGTGPASTLISTPDVKTFMFSDNTAASSGNNFTGRFYYMKINGNLYVPVKRNSDGAIGVYDTVTKTFFGNKGSGSFTAGPTVANTDVPANPTWTATWAADATTGVAAGTITGEGLCNAVTGTANTAATSAQMSSANWSVNGANCWCKASELTVGEEYSAAPSSISWGFRYTGSSAADCAYGCASACTYGVRTYASFRSALFGM